MKKLAKNLSCAQMILLFIFFFSISFTSQAQNLHLPKNHPIAVAAPHLPVIIRHEGYGRKFYGEINIYEVDKNRNNINKWIKNYPEELKVYKDAMVNYLKSIYPSSLSQSEKEIFYDLKSQWLLVSQIN